MASVTIKNVPDKVFESLRQSARANRRNLNSEVIAILERVVCSKLLAPADCLTRARCLWEKTSDYRIGDAAIEQAKESGRF